MNIKVDDQGAEREPEPITADVTGSMRRGLSYDPAEMLGERVSVEHVGLPSPDAHAVAAHDRWLIWSNQHGMWWRDHGIGYTSQIEEAGRYSRTEAERHVADATVNGRLTYQRRDPVTGRQYVAVDEVAVPAPYGATYLRRPTAVTLDQRLALGAILVEHRNRANDTAGAIDAILAALGLTADPPASHEGTTDSGEVDR